MLLTTLTVSADATGQERRERGQVRIGNAPVRYGVIWEGRLTRSGVPDEAQCLWLQNQGVKSVVTFRPKNDIDYARYGIANVLRIPLTGRNTPSNEDTERFLKFVQNPANWPVHIHCAEGQDRVGMMAALVRYAIDGWSLEKALGEARLYRRGEDLAEWRIDWLRTWAATHQPGSHRVEPPRG